MNNKCQHPGCSGENTTACFLPDNTTDKPDYYYCVKHAPQEGFCYCCGQFWAGVERFDFAGFYGGIKGLCENCDSSIRASLGEFDDDDEFYCALDFDD
ncbi:hypothetical protein [Iningainema tapete]|uniref:Uncharacterized protein n=1 Tax=Iningainema tapete BLCC-T55 TaxID=2748662 RepID=A0A8J6XDU0_9CYAN|nr:hypothetical protein [Iningainema tapete]MBD2771190.1 hypothetical protein [Iningainema tapete BLCC-T55]